MSNNFSEQNEENVNLIGKYRELVNEIQENKDRLEGLRKKCDGNIDKLKVFDKLIKKVDKLRIY